MYAVVSSAQSAEGPICPEWCDGDPADHADDTGALHRGTMRVARGSVLITVECEDLVSDEGTTRGEAVARLQVDPESSVLGRGELTALAAILIAASTALS